MLHNNQQLQIDAFYFRDFPGLLYHSGEFWHNDKKLSRVNNVGSVSVLWKGTRIGEKKLLKQKIPCKICSIIAIEPMQAHELMLQAVCQYYKMDKGVLLDVSKKSTGDTVLKRGMFFRLLRYELKKTDADIRKMYAMKRQTVTWAIDKSEWDTKHTIQSACDYDTILGMYSSLMKEQQEWLTHKNSSLPLQRL